MLYFGPVSDESPIILEHLLPLRLTDVRRSGISVTAHLTDEIGIELDPDTLYGIAWSTLIYLERRSVTSSGSGEDAYSGLLDDLQATFKDVSGLRALYAFSATEGIEPLDSDKSAFIRVGNEEGNFIVPGREDAVLLARGGDDTISVSQLQWHFLDGGQGIDTLVIQADAPQWHLDFSRKQVRENELPVAYLHSLESVRWERQQPGGRITASDSMTQLDIRSGLVEVESADGTLNVDVRHNGQLSVLLSQQSGAIVAQCHGYPNGFDALALRLTDLYLNQQIIQSWLQETDNPSLTISDTVRTELDQYGPVWQFADRQAVGYRQDVQSGGDCSIALTLAVAALPSGRQGQIQLLALESSGANGIWLELDGLGRLGIRTATNRRTQSRWISRPNFFGRSLHHSAARVTLLVTFSADTEQMVVYRNGQIYAIEREFTIPDVRSRTARFMDQSQSGPRVINLEVHGLSVTGETLTEQDATMLHRARNGQLMRLSNRAFGGSASLDVMGCLPRQLTLNGQAITLQELDDAGSGLGELTEPPVVSSSIVSSIASPTSQVSGFFTASPSWIQPTSSLPVLSSEVASPEPTATVWLEESSGLLLNSLLLSINLFPTPPYEGGEDDDEPEFPEREFPAITPTPTPEITMEPLPEPENGVEVDISDDSTLPDSDQPISWTTVERCIKEWSGSSVSDVSSALSSLAPATMVQTSSMQTTSLTASWQTSRIEPWTATVSTVAVTSGMAGKSTSSLPEPTPEASIRVAPFICSLPQGAYRFEVAAEAASIDMEQGSVSLDGQQVWTLNHVNTVSWASPGSLNLTGTRDSDFILLEAGGGNTIIEGQGGGDILISFSQAPVTYHYRAEGATPVVIDYTGSCMLDFGADWSVSQLAVTHNREAYLFWLYPQGGGIRPEGSLAMMAGQLSCDGLYNLQQGVKPDDALCVSRFGNSSGNLTSGVGSGSSSGFGSGSSSGFGSGSSSGVGSGSSSGDLSSA